jgi:hypothetical protein
MDGIVFVEAVYQKHYAGEVGRTSYECYPGSGEGILGAGFGGRSGHFGEARFEVQVLGSFQLLPSLIRSSIICSDVNASGLM